MAGPEARERLSRARLMLVVRAKDEAAGVAYPALANGVDAVQLRDPSLSDAELLATAGRLRRICAEHDALLVVNARPELAALAQADGVHLESSAAVRADDLLVGLSVADRDEIEAARVVDYLFVGPVFETPTKPGRPPVGLGLVREAARCAPVPFFAVGGIDSGNVGDVLAAGATRIAVVRAIADAPDPGAAARLLRRELDAQI